MRSLKRRSSEPVVRLLPGAMACSAQRDRVRIRGFLPEAVITRVCGLAAPFALAREASERPDPSEVCRIPHGAAPLLRRGLA